MQDKIRQLRKVAQGHSISKIRLQCCWTFASFINNPDYDQNFPENELIVSCLCKILKESLLTFKPLFYFGCAALQRIKAAKFIIKHRVYEIILTVNVKQDRNLIFQPLYLLFITVGETREIISVLLENGICNYIFECLCIAKRQETLSLCVQILYFLAKGTFKQVMNLMDHQSLLPKLVQLFRRGQIPMKIFEYCFHSSPYLFTQIFVDMIYPCELKQLRLFQDRLISFGIIDTLVKIMAVNLGNKYIEKNVLFVLHCLLGSGSQFRKTRFYAQLLQLQGVKMIESMKGETIDKILYPDTRRNSRFSSTPSKSAK